MELNRKSHPDCVYASNPYHECASACLERIAQGNGRNHTKKQASKILTISASLGKKKKESKPPSPYASRPYQNNAVANNNVSPKDHRPNSVTNKTFLEETKTFSSSSSSEDLPAEQYSRSEQEPLSQTVLLSPNNLVVDYTEDEIQAPGKQEHNDKNGSSGEIRRFSFLSPTRSHGNDAKIHHDDDDDEENNGVLGEEIELESIVSESCLPVGKYRVRRAAAATLRSIIDRHGDIAANCKLESASMRARYLECLCALVQELKSTPVAQLTKLEVKEMILVLKDLDSVNIDVGWLSSVLEDFAQSREAEAAKERHKELVSSTRRELEDREEGLARMEEEVVEARARVEETRARVAKLEKELSRLEGIGSKAEKFKGKSFLDELL